MTTVDLVDTLLKTENNNNFSTKHVFFNKSNKIKFLFLRSERRSSWLTDTNKLWGPDIESEFIVEILTNDSKDNIFEFMSIPKNYNINNINSCDILAYSSNVYNVSFISNIVNKLKPKVLLHLSDERGNRPNYKVIFNNVNLVYRQYNFTHLLKYQYEKNININYLPLGYHSWGKNYYRTNIKPISQRQYVWCFSGSNKNKRAQQLKVLSVITPHFNKKTKPLTTRNMFIDSKFCFCPEGNINIECSRIYESMYNGCVPIIVGSKEKILPFKKSFKYEIPCYYVYNVEDALKILKNTSDSELNKKQKQCFDWLNKTKQYIRKDIIDACK